MDWTGTYTVKQFYEKTIAHNCYPHFRTLIQMQLHFYEWWDKATTNFIVRRFSNYQRARLYNNSDGVSFLTVDNEACVALYDYIYHNGPIRISKGLFEFFKENSLPVSYGPKGHSYNSQDFVGDAREYGFLLGGVKDILRSKYQLKLSHYRECSGDEEGDIKLKSAILLSPLNIILTPKTKRKTSGYIHEWHENGIEMPLYRKDIGETRKILEILHALLVSDILNTPKGYQAYQAYCKMCGLDIGNQLERKVEYIPLAEVNTFSFTSPMPEATTCKDVIAPNMVSHQNKIDGYIITSSTRFRVTQKLFEKLERNPHLDWKHIVNPQQGNHPPGIYQMPNYIAKSFIQQKQQADNWRKYSNFNQDGIPSGLDKFFKPSKTDK